MRDLARPEQGSPSASAEPAPGPLRSLGEATAEIELRFVEAGAAALVLIQSPDLAQIEIRDGREAALCCFQELAELVERAAAPVLEPGDLVLSVENVVSGTMVRNLWMRNGRPSPRRRRRSSAAGSWRRRRFTPTRSWV